MTEQNKSVDILIPCFNQLSLIEQTIESALCQTYDNFRIIISDDASRIDTIKKLQKYQDNPKIKISLNPVNLGMVKNHRHLLHDLSTADYAVMLDGDDYFIDENYIKNASSILTTTKLDMLFSDAKILDEKDGSIKSFSFPFKNSGIYDCTDILEKNVLFMHGAVMYKRTTAIECDFYSKPLPLGEDNEGFNRLILGRKVYYLKEPTYMYRINSTNISKYNIDTKIRGFEFPKHVLKSAYDNHNQNTIEVVRQWYLRMNAKLFLTETIVLLQKLYMKKFVIYCYKYIKKYGIKEFCQTIFNSLKYIIRKAHDI